MLSPIGPVGGLGFDSLGIVVVKVVTGRLPEGVHGYTDGVTVFVDDRLTAEQLLCTLMHESIHIERGQGTKQLESEEMAVRYETARRLLPLDRLVGVCKTGTLSQTAKLLGVTKRVLMDRAVTLTDSQASDAGCWDCQKCPAIRLRAAAIIAA